MAGPLPYDAVFFDLFDTLIRIDYHGFPKLTVSGQDRPTTAGKLHEWLIAEGVRVDLEKFTGELIAVWMEISREKAKAHTEVSALTRYERVLPRIGVSDPAEVADRARRMTRMHMNYLVEHARPVDRATELLEACARSLPVALISNFDDTEAGEAIIDKFGWRTHFKSIVISDALGLCKPRRELYDRAVSDTGIPHHRAVMVGDTHLADVKGAKDAGLSSVWINPKGTALGDAQIRPDHEIRALAELFDILPVK